MPFSKHARKASAQCKTALLSVLVAGQLQAAPTTPTAEPPASAEPPADRAEPAVAPSGPPPSVWRSDGTAGPPEIPAAAAADAASSAPPNPAPNHEIEPSAAEEPLAPDEGLSPEPPLAADEQVADTDPSALTDFSGMLEGHGSWVDHPSYGTVWIPAPDVVGADFAPYVTRGHWALTADDRWIWVSDYPFGWAVFHHGRWVWIPSYGWSWIPGRRYSPAWVAFRTSYWGSPYVGWAPLPPRYIWVNGRAVWLTQIPPSPYVFVSSRMAFHPSLARHVLRHRSRTRSLAQRSRPYRPSRPEPGRYYSPPLDVARVPSGARPQRRVQLSSAVVKGKKPGRVDRDERRPKRLANPRPRRGEGDKRPRAERQGEARSQSRARPPSKTRSRPRALTRPRGLTKERPPTRRGRALPGRLPGRIPSAPVRRVPRRR